MNENREMIIQKAIMAKLSGNAIDLFTAEDILAVAKIDDEQLNAISQTISNVVDKCGNRKEERR